jgi:excinuclease UvrABC nuclease subunit
MQKRLMSTNTKVVYSNAELQREQIMKDTQGKSGIYQWTNTINMKSYVGSGLDLKKRLSHYYSLKYMNKKISLGQSAIYSALLKYGPSHFSLAVLEYCNRDILIKREQFYIDLLKPEYNLSKTAGGGRRFGFIVTEETRKKMSVSQKAIDRSGKNHPMFGKARPEGAGSISQKISVFDLIKNERTEYNSIREASNGLVISYSSIKSYLRRGSQKAFKNRYIFVKI